MKVGMRSRDSLYLGSIYVFCPLSIEETSLFMKKPAYKWIALSVTTIGALMVAIDSTIVILALPNMLEDLHSDLVHMTWVLIGYLLVNTVLQLTFGRMADMFGRVRLYNLVFVVFK